MRAVLYASEPQYRRVSVACVTLVGMAIKPTPPDQRWWSHVHKDGPTSEWVAGRCWLWNGIDAGYAKFRIGGKGSPHIGAHRFGYELLVGPIPDGFVIDHLCRRPSCVNPDHLEAVTQQTNLLRGDSIQARNAFKTHCKHGHPFDEENTHYRPTGGRSCRTCRRMRVRRWRERQRQGGDRL